MMIKEPQLYITTSKAIQEYLKKSKAKELLNWGRRFVELMNNCTFPIVACLFIEAI